MARAAAETARLESVLFASLEYLAGKRVRREHLFAGSETPVQGVINSTVGRSIVEVPFAGRLTVGVDQKLASSAAPNATHVVAWLLEQFTAADRNRILAQLPGEFEMVGELPGVSDERLAQADELLKRLRAAKTTTKRGAIIFELDGG